MSEAGRFCNSIEFRIRIATAAARNARSNRCKFRCRKPLPSFSESQLRRGSNSRTPADYCEYPPALWQSPQPAVARSINSQRTERTLDRFRLISNAQFADSVLLLPLPARPTRPVELRSSEIRSQAPLAIVRPFPSVPSEIPNWSECKREKHCRRSLATRQSTARLNRHLISFHSPPRPLLFPFRSPLSFPSTHQSRRYSRKPRWISSPPSTERIRWDQLSRPTSKSRNRR